MEEDTELRRIVRGVSEQHSLPKHRLQPTIQYRITTGEFMEAIDPQYASGYRGHSQNTIRANIPGMWHPYPKDKMPK